MSEPAPRQHHNVTLAVLATSALCYALSQTMIAPALPRIQDELGASTTGISWALTGFLLAASIATPILGRLGDMFGKKRMLLLTLILFTAGSLIGALSHTLPVLIAARFVQGTSSGVFPLAYGIVRDEFPQEKAAAAIGLISGTFGIGGGLGLVLSGVIVDNLSYEWIFWIAGAVALLTLVATHRWVPESPIRNPARIDWGGAALMGVGLAALLIAISEVDTWGWTGARTLGLVAVSLIVLVGWAAFESRTAEPMVDMKLLRERGVPTTNLSTLLIGFGMFASFIIIPQFVQTPEDVGYGASVTGAGLFMLPSTLIMLAAGPVAGSIAAKRGAKLPMAAGAALMVVGFAAIAAFHSEPWELIAGSLVFGWGIGMSFASMANLIVELVPQKQTGEATGMNTIMRTVGGSLGAQVSATILTEHMVAGGNTTTDAGFTIAFGVIAFVLLLGVVAALAIPGRLLGEREGPAGEVRVAAESP